MHAYERCTPMGDTDDLCEKHAYEMAAYERHAYEMAPVRKRLMREAPMRDTPMRWPMGDARL